MENGVQFAMIISMTKMHPSSAQCWVSPSKYLSRVTFFSYNIHKFRFILSHIKNADYDCYDSVSFIYY